VTLTCVIVGVIGYFFIPKQILHDQQQIVLMLDWEASNNARSSFKEFVIFLIPELFAFTLSSACLEFIYQPPDNEQLILPSSSKCSHVIWIAIFLKGFLLDFHSAVFNPFALLYRTSDLRSSLQHISSLQHVDRHAIL